MFITRGGFAGGSTGIFVDTLKAKGATVDGGVAYYEAYRGKELVASFPAGTQYLLVKKDQIDLITAVDAAARQKEEEDAVNEVFKKDEKKDAGLDVPAFPDAAYR